MNEELRVEPHSEEPVEVAQAFGLDDFWTSLW